MRRSGFSARRTDTMWSLPNGDKRLPVERGEDFSAVVVRQRLNPDFAGAGHDDGPVGQRVRRDGSNRQTVHLRMHDGTARRQVVCGRARRTRDDEPIRFYAHHEFAVDRHRQLDDARERALRHHDVVEHDPIAPRRRSAASTRTWSIIRSSVCAVPWTADSSDE